MNEYIVLEHPELKIYDGDKVIKDFRYAINTKENEIKVYEEVENKLYNDSGNHHSISYLLDLISQPPMNKPYNVGVYKVISECEVENEG